MDSKLKDLFGEFHEAAKESTEKNNKHIVIDRIYENFDDLSLYPFPEVLSQILELIERFPELDYGGSGPFGSFIEEHKSSEYAQALIDSIYRQPSTQVIGWIDRVVTGLYFDSGRILPSELARDFGTCLESVVSSPKASECCKDFARSCMRDLKRRGLVGA